MFKKDATQKLKQASVRSMSDCGSTSEHQDILSDINKLYSASVAGDALDRFGLGIGLLKSNLYLTVIGILLSEPFDVLKRHLETKPINLVKLEYIFNDEELYSKDETNICWRASYEPLKKTNSSGLTLMATISIGYDFAISLLPKGLDTPFSEPIVKDSIMGEVEKALGKYAKEIFLLQNNSEPTKTVNANYTDLKNPDGYYVYKAPAVVLDDGSSSPEVERLAFALLMDNLKQLKLKVTGNVSSIFEKSEQNIGLSKGIKNLKKEYVLAQGEGIKIKNRIPIAKEIKGELKEGEKECEIKLEYSFFDNNGEEERRTSGLLMDSTKDNDPIKELRIVTEPAIGKINDVSGTILFGEFIYMLGENEQIPEGVTEVKFTYQISDGADWSEPATVTISINSGCNSDFTNAIGMNFVKIEPGTFIMGVNSDYYSFYDYSYYEIYNPDTYSDFDIFKQHFETIAEPFCMQTTEVTQGQWMAVMGYNRSTFKNCGMDCPVENISYNDAQRFIANLNEKGEGTYSLPTNAQWEYAAKAGSTTDFADGNMAGYFECSYDANANAIGWYCGNSRVSYGGYCDNARSFGGLDECIGTHPVAQKSPNAWGLYDMQGNVAEWCQNEYVDIFQRCYGCELRSLMGHSYRSHAWYFLRLEIPDFHTLDSRYLFAGFRLVKLAE